MSHLFMKVTKMETNNKIICPICGKEMDETENGKHYCYDCEQELKGNYYG